MRAVQQAQFHQLERCDIGDKLRAGQRPIGASVREMVLDHPLRKRLRHHRPRIAHTQTRADPRAILIGSGWHNPVHHRAGAGQMLFDVAAKRRVTHLRQPRQHPLYRAPVGGQIIAA